MIFGDLLCRWWWPWHRWSEWMPSTILGLEGRLCRRCHLMESRPMSEAEFKRRVLASKPRVLTYVKPEWVTDHLFPFGDPHCVYCGKSESEIVAGPQGPCEKAP